MQDEVQDKTDVSILFISVQRREFYVLSVYFLLTANNYVAFFVIIYQADIFIGFSMTISRDFGFGFCFFRFWVFFAARRKMNCLWLLSQFGAKYSSFFLKHH